MIITYVWADNPHEFNTSNWRCYMPAKAINRYANGNVAYLLPIVEFENDTETSKQMCALADIIVIERNFKGTVNKLVDRYKEEGKIVCANFDDAYNLTRSNNPSYNYWMLGEVQMRNDKGEILNGHLDPKPIVQFEEGLKKVHAILCPNKQLAKDWEHCAPSYYFPNWFETERYTKLSEKDFNASEIIVGWGGSMSHFESFMDSGAVSALQRVCRQRPNVKVMIAGDERVFAKLNIPKNQKMFQPFVPFEKWAEVVNRFDIGLAILAGSYDKRRSWIKPMEYMLLKKPWLASDNDAYNDLREYGTIVKNTANRWESAILDVVDNFDKYKEKTKASYEFALKADIDNQVVNILGFFQQIAKDNGKNITF